VANLIPGMP